MLRYTYAVSKGPGHLQRWIMANLPPPTSGPRQQFDRLASPAKLAAAYYRVNPATDAQCTAVRRALRGLEQRGLATRWGTEIYRQGCPSGWSQPVVR